MISPYYIEILTFCVGLYNYKRLKNSYMFWFIPFLGVTFIAEVSSDYIYHIYYNDTSWIFNFLIPITTLFYSFIIFSLIRDQRLKIPFISIGLIYLLIIGYLLSVATSFSIPSVLLSSIILVILSCYYFYRCLLDDVDLNAFYVKSGLWIASGILIFYSGICIVFSLFDYIRTHHLAVNGTPLYNFVPRVLSIILYSCFMVAFVLWRKPQKI